MDKFRIDSHKLIYHPERVAQWKRGEDVYPIYVEAAPAGACNHRCTYCALDYMEYKPRLLDKDIFLKRVSEMSSLGIKSIMYAGEGEPFLHKGIGEIINRTKTAGIDVSITSNGVLFTEKLARETLSSITWIKVSFNAGTKETYAKVHRTNEADFDKALSNIKTAVRIRNSEGLKTTIGMQMILLPENANEALQLTQLAKDAGADYLVIKSYSQHLKSLTHQYEGFKYSDYFWLDAELKKFCTPQFNVVFRLHTMQKLEEGRTYDRCLALPFWAYIDAGGGVWGCSAYLGDERFYFGCLYDQSFEEIWKGDRRKKAMEFVRNELDTSECRQNCRMDEINRYLWELAHPSLHVNFI